MGIKEKLEGRAPHNESTTYLRRTKLRFEQGKDEEIKDAQKVLLDAGVFDILEELLETVRDSSFDYHRTPRPKPLDLPLSFDIPSLGSSGDLFNSSDYFDRLFTPVTVTLQFVWNDRTEDQKSLIGDVDFESRCRIREFLRISSQAGSPDITINSSSYSIYDDLGVISVIPLYTFSTDFYKCRLRPEQWKERDKLERTVVEALTLAGLTKSQLNLGGNE